jgi:ADP-ribose pyrophosphatase
MTVEMRTEGVDVIECVPAFQGYFRIDRYKVRHRRFDGGWSGVITREVFERGHAAAVLFYDPVTDEVGLTEQFRVGALAAGEHPWLIETVAGIIDEGETAESTAIREALEEGGVVITDPVPMLKALATPGGSSETVQLYCARIDATAIGGVHGIAAEDEDIRLFRLPALEALAWVDQGRIVNAMTIVAIQWLALHKEELKKRWA